MRTPHPSLFPRENHAVALLEVRNLRKRFGRLGRGGRLVVNDFITNNLANFLIELKGRVGIVAKGCDSRSIVSLIQDNKVAREDVIILGIPCTGIIDLSKIEKLTSKDRDELDEIVIKISGKNLSIKHDLSKPQGVRGRNADLTLIKKVLGWKPQISLEEGLRRTYRWILSQVSSDSMDVSSRKEEKCTIKILRGMAHA